MDLVNFPEKSVVIAEDQPEYRPMPAYIDPAGNITCCWRLSLKERVKLLFTGKIWHTIMTFNEPLQPQLLQVDKPLMDESL